MEQELSNELFICGGCNAKIGPGVLGDLLSQFPKQENPNFLVGFDSSDDAAVFRIDAETAMIQTLDFFPAMVADASLFGEIAAANALSDVFAMGGEVLTAMNIVCWPETKSTDTLGKILAGGFKKVQEAGGVLVGGHSIHDSQPKYGLSVLGRVHPDRIYRNDTCVPGDVLLLTKPLGNRHHHDGLQRRGNGAGSLRPGNRLDDDVEPLCGGSPEKVHSPQLHRYHRLRSCWGICRKWSATAVPQQSTPTACLA